MSFVSAARILTRGTALSLGGGVGALAIADQSGSDLGAVRSFRFWKGMVPIYAHYKLVEWRLRDEQDDAIKSATYRPLNERYSPIVERLALDLKGFYFKLAQIMSTRDDFLPDEYIEWTKRLQDKSSNVMPTNEVLGIVERSLGVRAEEYFSQWDDEPVGAASVGQVHRARLKSTGQDVAVKVQYPGMERMFRNDIETVEAFCKFLMPQNTAYFSEIKKQFVTEFDMRGEAENLREVHDNLHQAGWQRCVEVPEPIASSKDVLVMTYLDGPKLVDGVRAQFQKMAERRGKTLEELEEEQKRLLEEGKVQRQEVSAAAAATRRLELLLSGRNLLVNSVLLAWNFTVRPVLGLEKAEYWSNAGMVNLGEVIQTLLQVHGHEIFADGAFNGDPHPGNFVLMNDGRIGLVDYGQVKRMTLQDRILYAKFIVALSRDDKDEVVRLFKDVGIRTKFMKAEILYKMAAFYNCRDTDDILEGMNVSEFMEWIEKTDPLKETNDDFVMAARVSLLLRGLTNAFAMKVRVSDYWKGEAQAFLQSQGIEY